MKLRSSFNGISLVTALLILGAHPAWSAAAEPFPTATPESQGLTSQSLGKLLDEVRGFVDKGDIVGGELLVIKNRRTVLHEAVGLSDRENKKPLKPDTIYCIRSMTKPLIGAAVQILIDEGRLSLDDTAAKYLPSFDNDKSRGITVRQLLTHTGGLPLSTLLNNDFRELTSLRDVVDISGKNGPIFPPGKNYQYSDDGADTLGAIVSAITGQAAEAFITKRILEPLGMNDTFPLAREAGDKLNRFTPAYMGTRGNWTRFASPAEKPLFSYFLASQSMYSTTRDYARFLALYLDQGRAGDQRVLSEAAVKRTLEPVNASGAPISFPRLTAYYGQMMETYVDADKKLVVFGHGGSDGTWAFAWPEHDLMVLYYTQSRGNATGIDLEAAIDRLLLGGTAAPIVQDMSAEAAAPYLGVYWFEPQQRPMIIVRDKGRLALEIPSQGLVELKNAEEPQVWTLVPAPNNSLKFHRDGDGPATAFDFRRAHTVTLPRFIPEAGLPSLDELLARRPDHPQRAEKLASLGTMRLSGNVELTVSEQKGSFEALAAGDDRAGLKIKVGGVESQQVVAGDRGWFRYAPSLPVQEMSAAMAKASRLNGLLLASGGWRGAFEQVRVLKRVELGGRFAFLVHAAPAEGRQRLIYLDAENGLTLGYDEVQDVPGLGMIGCEVRFADYRDVDGVQIPFKTTVKYPTPMLGTQIYQAEKIETRLKLNKDPFILK
jgi:CubicO group peptidase (beta-lactamase class C family)